MGGQTVCLPYANASAAVADLLLGPTQDITTRITQLQFDDVVVKGKTFYATSMILLPGKVLLIGYGVVSGQRTSVRVYFVIAGVLNYIVHQNFWMKNYDLYKMFSVKCRKFQDVFE